MPAAILILAALVLQNLLHTSNADVGGILVNPSNQTVPMNTTTSFFCKASGRNARWYVNGTLVVNEEQYAELGIMFSETSESTSPDDHIHTFNMTITVVASVAINATNFICLVYVDGTSVSETAQLIVMGGPAPPNVSLHVVNATTLQLSWDPPFTWPEYEILNYTVRMENRSSGITERPVVLTPTDLTYRLTGSAPVQHCAELRFNVTASNALGDSAPAVVTGGFPKVPVFHSETTHSICFQQDETPNLQIEFELPRVCSYQEIAYAITLQRVDIEGDETIVIGPIIVPPYSDQRSAPVQETIRNGLVMGARYSVVVSVNTSGGMSTSSRLFFVDVTRLVTETVTATVTVTVTATVTATVANAVQVTATPTPSDILRANATVTVTTPALMDCPAEFGHTLFPGSGISYNWTETVAGSFQHLPCSGLRSCQELVGVSGGMVVRRCTAQGEWLEVDFRGCGLSVTTLQLCEARQQIASDAEHAAMVVVNITANASELEVPAIIVTTSIVEELTAEAIDQPEVRENYLQLIDNLLEAIPHNILESQRQANTSTRLHQSLREFVNTVPIPPNSTNNTQPFALKNFALLLQDVNPESFSGESLSVNLGPVEEAIRNSSGINEDALITMLDPLLNATASAKLPESLFDGNTTYASPWQRIVYSVFLTNVLFLTLDTNCGDSAVGSIILGVNVNSSVINSSVTNSSVTNSSVTNVSTGEIHLAFQQFRMSCDDEIPAQSTAMCSNFAGEGQYGRWTTDSCRVVSDNGATTQCMCTQLGHFSLLFDLNPGGVFAPGAIFLAAVTYVGTTISVLCLVATVITYTAFKKLHSPVQGSAGVHGQLLINLSCSLIGVYVTFIVAGLVTTVPPLCGIVAALLQYFMLVFFGWTAVEALFLYQKLVRSVLGQISPYFVPIAATVVWLAPIVVVGISAGAGYRHYVNPFYCRVIMYPFWFGLIVPFVVVHLFNWAMFIIIIACLLKNRKNVKKKSELKRHFFLVLGLSLVFGLGWGLGLLATSSEIQKLTFTFQILFSILIGSQGLLIFLFHVIRAPQAREQWKKLLTKCSCRKLARSRFVSFPKSFKTFCLKLYAYLSGKDDDNSSQDEEQEAIIN